MSIESVCRFLGYYLSVFITVWIQRNIFILYSLAQMGAHHISEKCMPIYLYLSRFHRKNGKSNIMHLCIIINYFVNPNILKTFLMKENISLKTSSLSKYESVFKWISFVETVETNWFLFRLQLPHDIQFDTLKRLH